MFKAYQTLCRISPAYSHKQIIKKRYFIQYNLIKLLSPSSMVRTVYSVYHGATRIQKGLLPVAETDSGKYASLYLSYFVY